MNLTLYHKNISIAVITALNLASLVQEKNMISVMFVLKAWNRIIIMKIYTKYTILNLVNASIINIF